MISTGLEIVSSGDFRIPDVPTHVLIEEGNQHLAYGGGQVEDESLFPHEKLTKLMTNGLSSPNTSVNHSPDADSPRDFGRTRGANSPSEWRESGSVELDQTQVRVTTRLPWRSICDLMITTGNGQQEIATGFLIGRRTVITAGHVVVLPPGKLGNDGDKPLWSKKITVSPGMSRSENGDILQPFGSMTSSRFFSVRPWFDVGRPDLDIGCVLLPEPTLGDRVSWFGFAALGDSELAHLIVNVAGYPVARPPGSMWYDAGRIAEVESLRLQYDLETGPGTSGGPTFRSGADQRMVVGIHNYGSDNNGLSTRITPEVFHVLQAWKTMGQSV